MNDSAAAPQSDPTSPDRDAPIPLKRWLLALVLGAGVFLVTSIVGTILRVPAASILGMVVGAVVAGLVLPARKPTDWVAVAAMTLMASILLELGMFTLGGALAQPIAP